MKKFILSAVFALFAGLAFAQGGGEEDCDPDTMNCDTEVLEPSPLDSGTWMLFLAGTAIGWRYIRR